jgi:hypothetical protein
MLEHVDHQYDIKHALDHVLGDVLPTKLPVGKPLSQGWKESIGNVNANVAPGAKLLAELGVEAGTTPDLEHAGPEQLDILVLQEIRKALTGLLIHGSIRLL